MAYVEALGIITHTESFIPGSGGASLNRYMAIASGSLPATTSVNPSVTGKEIIDLKNKADVDKENAIRAALYRALLGATARAQTEARTKYFTALAAWAVDMASRSSTYSQQTSAWVNNPALSNPSSATYRPAPRFLATPEPILTVHPAPPPPVKLTYSP